MPLTCPAGELFQGFLPWIKGLHADQPTEEEAMRAILDADTPTQKECGIQENIGDGDHWQALLHPRKTKDKL